MHSRTSPSTRAGGWITPLRHVRYSSLLHAEAGLTSKIKKTGQWKAGRADLIKKLKKADALGVVDRHPMRQWRVSDVAKLASVLEETKQKEVELADSSKSSEETEIST